MLRAKNDSKDLMARLMGIKFTQVTKYLNDIQFLKLQILIIYVNST